MKLFLAGSFFLIKDLTASGQDARSQYPFYLQNASFSANVGYINYSFSNSELKSGYRAESIHIPHTAVRIILYDFPFNKFLSARLTYMRPAKWLEYRNVNGDNENHTIWMNIGGVSLNTRIPIQKRLSISAETGLAMVTRKGFEINNIPIVSNAIYATALFGGTLEYHFSNNWDIQFMTSYSPGSKRVKQPSTIFYGAGLSYFLRPIPQSKVEKNAKSGFTFPNKFIQLAYTTNRFGYGMNHFVSDEKTFPIFWGGEAQIRSGFSLFYQKNIFHNRKWFSIDWASSIGFWKSDREKKSFFTLSLNPVFRFNIIRSKDADLFFEYSFAGPAFISRTIIDGHETGKNFTFYDFMGIGIFTGKKKNLLTGLSLAHYSNGNIFPQNSGIMIPLTFNVGYVL